VDLLEELTAAAARPAELYFSGATGLLETSWAELVAAGERAAAALSALGVGPATRVGCLLSNDPSAAATVYGVWYLGATVVSLPLPSRGLAPARYAAQLDDITAQAGASLILMEERFTQLAESFPERLKVVAYEQLDGRGGRVEPNPLARDDIAFVQYSSGSTSEPRGCVLTCAAIEAQLDLLRDWLAVDAASDRGVIWLPLSHDMGFFGGLLLWWSIGGSGVISSPERFLSQPRSWLGDCADFAATVTVGPEAALRMALRAAHDALPRLELRTLLLGGERINWDALVASARILEPAGVPFRALTPAYGLAEATLAVTIGRLGDEPHARTLDALALSDNRIEHAREGHAGVGVVSVGPALPGVTVAIDGPDEIGEILVRSPSAASGYIDMEATPATFANGWVRTGDLGFLAGDELHVVGRRDDLLTVGARNVWARDVEPLIDELDGVRTGCCAIIDAFGSLVVVAELSRGASDHEKVARNVAAVAARAAGLELAECIFVPRGQLPKTPSGKVQRYRVRQIAIGERAAGTARVPLRSRQDSSAPDRSDAYS